MARDDGLLEVSGLVKRFEVRANPFDRLRRRPRSLVAVDDVSFKLRPHETLGIVGESGSGKSTLARCLVRLLDPDEGTVALGPTDVTAAGPKRLAEVRRRMQLIYQDPYSSLNPLMTVEQAVAEPAVVHGLLGEGETAQSHAVSMLELVGMPAATGSRRPKQLSGGQRQRVAIARAMAARPELLIADEPVSALDVSIQAQVLNVFDRLRQERGLAIIFIAHQLSVVAHIAEVVLIMYLGRIVESGPTERVFNAPGHPYTAALMESQPGPHRRGRRPVLQGEIPSPLDIPSGCRFRSRCPMAEEICADVDPPPVDLGGGQSAHCHFAGRMAAEGIPAERGLV